MAFISSFTDTGLGRKKGNRGFVPIFHNTLIPALGVLCLAYVDLLVFSRANGHLLVMAILLMFVGLIGWIYSKGTSNLRGILMIATNLVVFLWCFYTYFPTEIFTQGTMVRSFFDSNTWLPTLVSDYPSVATGLMLIIVITSLIGSNISSELPEQNFSVVKYSKWNILIFTLIFLLLAATTAYFAESFIFFLPNLLVASVISVLILNCAQHRKNEGSRFEVIRILDPNADIQDSKILDLEMAVLGDPGSGKSSYVASLWTLLTNRDVREIWWSDGPLDSKTEVFQQDIEQLDVLAERGREKISVDELFELRVARTTCAHFGNRFPANNESGFPIRAEAYGNSEITLNKFRENFTNPSSGERKLLPPTESTNKELRFHLSFNGEVRDYSPRYFSNVKMGGSTSRKRLEMVVKTPDIIGESFRYAVKALRNKISEDLVATRSDLLSFKVSEEMANSLYPGRGFSFDPDSINWVIREILTSSNLILVTDVPKLVNGEDDNTEGFLSLLSKLYERKCIQASSVTVLLNKADDLMGKNDEGDLLEYWGEMNDLKLAGELLNRLTNSALDQLKMTGMGCNVSFCCSVGGLIGEKSGARPIYPMVPVNVIEPLLTLVLEQTMAES